jgi:hypothetical protein
MKMNDYAGLILSVFLIFLSIGGIGCGGGGSDESSNSLIPEGPITYNIGNYWYTDDAGQDLQIVRGGTALINLWADLEGVYDTRTEQISVKQNRSITAQSTSLWEEYNSYVNTCIITVLNEIQMNMGDFPTQGAWKITFDGQSFDLLGFDSINMEITGTGVTMTAYLSDNPVEGMSESLTWEELSDIEDQDDPPAYQFFCWVGYSVWIYYYEIIGIEYSSMKQIYDNATDLALNETVTVNGPVFPPDTGTRGKLVLTWIDSSGDRIMGQRDSFACSFTNWWEDVPANDRDGLFDGDMYLTEFIKNDNDLGFNCSFNNFILRETFNGSADEDSRLTMNGGFHLHLSWE